MHRGGADIYVVKKSHWIIFFSAQYTVFMLYFSETILFHERATFMASETPSTNL
jgi:hypothetical protein